MAKILTEPVKFAKGAYRGGLGSGLIAGISQGIPAAIGLHPFFARLAGGLVASAIIKNPIDKRIILVESMKESVYQLMAAD